MGVAGFQVEEHQGDMPLDAHEQVVEVMGDSAGQGADGLHLLGGLKLFFQFLFLGNIGDEVKGGGAPFPSKGARSSEGSIFLPRSC